MLQAPQVMMATEAMARAGTGFFDHGDQRRRPLRSRVSPPAEPALSCEFPGTVPFSLHRATTGSRRNPSRPLRLMRIDRALCRSAFPTGCLRRTRFRPQGCVRSRFPAQTSCISTSHPSLMRQRHFIQAAWHIGLKAFRQRQMQGEELPGNNRRNRTQPLR